jgi:hypothetical protein
MSGESDDAIAQAIRLVAGGNPDSPSGLELLSMAVNEMTQAIRESAATIAEALRDIAEAFPDGS